MHRIQHTISKIATMYAVKTAYVANLVKVHYMTYSIDPYPTYTKTNKHVKPWIGQPTAMQGPKIIENCII